MKVAHFADIHISDARIQEFEKILGQLGKQVREQNPDLIVFAGDMFVHRDKLSPKQVQLTRKFFKETLDGYSIIIIPGNHDASMSEIKVDSLSAVFTNDSLLKVYGTIGEYVDIDNYRFHMFGYPSKKELVNVGAADASVLHLNKKVLNAFTLDPSKKNVLIYHGTLEGFNISDSYLASEEAIGVGKDVIMSKVFWSQFDAVMAGHLHKYQGIEEGEELKCTAVYPGCPAPLNFADSSNTGWVLWEDLKPKFMELPQLYPYQTVDAGDISTYKTELTRELLRRINNTYDYTDVRVRVKYKVGQKQTGEVNHVKVSGQFKNAKDIKIVPQYKKIKQSGTISFENFQQHTIKDLIFKYIDDHKFNPGVKKVAEVVEARLKKKHLVEEDKGINFKPDSLKVSNFKCFGPETPTLVFGELSPVVGVFGPNKTGKSSLVESIVWALFGITLRNKDVKSVIRNEETQCSVELHFTSHNSPYKIERIRAKTGTILKLSKMIEENWIDISGADIKTTQVNIEKLVGTFDVFVSTVYSPQNKIDLLVEKKPADRRKIVLDCLQIDVLDKRVSEVNLLKKEIRDKLQQSQGRLTAYTEQLNNLVDSKPHELLEEFNRLLYNEKVVQGRLLTHIEELSKNIHSYEEMGEEYKELDVKLGKIREETEGLRYKIKLKRIEQERMEGILADRSVITRGLQRQQKFQEKLAEASEEIVRNNERRNQISAFKRDIEKLEAEHKDVLKSMETARGSLIGQIEDAKLLDCSKADCPLNARIQEQKSKVRIKLEETNEIIENQIKEHLLKVSDVKDRIIHLESLLESSPYDKQKHMEWVGLHKEETQNKWKEMEQKLSSGVNILENIMELLVAYGLQKDDLFHRRDSMVVRRSELATRIATIDRHKKELADTRLDLTECNKKTKNYETQVYRCEQGITDIRTLSEQVEKEKERRERIEDYQLYTNKYTDLVSKTGVIFGIVDKALPIIEKFAQDLLAETTNGMISISIDSYKTLSSGGSRDEISIYISDAKGKRDVLEASGSELVLVSLALRAAMAHLLSLRMGSMVELFIVDEGMGALDDENKVVVKDIFKRLGEIFNRVLFITHITELKDVAQSVIEVSSNGRISTFKVSEKIDGKE